ncbi:MAG TPA: hypothetical protein VFZ44_16620 [Pyrinomonadaceae bacterium]
MITGFNTDVPFDGVTYHVQTEDKGLETPLILSLVYVGGAIIAAKRTPYEDLISKGFDEKALTERLQRQHKLIIAAIKNGRVEELKRMGGANGAQEPEAQAHGPASAGKKTGAQRRKKSDAAPPAAEVLADPTADADTPIVEAAGQTAEAVTTPQTEETTSPSAEAPASPTGAKTEPEIVILGTLADEINALEDFMPRAASMPPEPPAEVPPAQAGVIPVSDAAAAEPVLTAGAVVPPQELSNELYLTLLDDEGEFRAGQLATVKVYVGRGAYGQSPEAEASVTVKVLGTSFRPLILSTATDALGVGVVRALLPRFTSGRAAIIIRAVAGDDAAEMRRIIHQ